MIIQQKWYHRAAYLRQHSEWHLHFHVWRRYCSGDVYRDTERQHTDRECLWTLHGWRDVYLPVAVYWHTSMT
jgi:hypothetical protein